MQFLEACYTVVSYAPYILLRIYTKTILATFRVTIFDFFHPGPQPILKCQDLQGFILERGNSELSFLISQPNILENESGK